MPEIVLFPGRERSVKQRHPWIFSGAIQAVNGIPQPGDTVEVISADGDKLGRAAFSPTSQIRARMWTWDPEESIDKQFFKRRVEVAGNSREVGGLNKKTNAIRLIYAESDGLPGLIVDKYGDFLVVQILSAGCERWREVIIQVLMELFSPKGIFERSDVEVRHLEGLEQKTGVMWGEEPPDRIMINENGLEFLVDIRKGQKTGFYLDQRQNRQEVLNYVKQRELLNCFCYTGAFSLFGAKGGASKVTSIDSSGEALNLAMENLTLNGFSTEAAEWIEGDVFLELRRFRDAARKFDVIVLDPPKFAATQAQVQKAARAYKDINLLAFKLLRTGGILITFSCSGGVDMQLFQKIVAGAAVDAKVDAQIIKYLGQDLDHPIALNFPESAYLKGLICRVF